MPRMNKSVLSREYAPQATTSSNTAMVSDLKTKRMSQDTKDCVNILLTLKNRSGISGESEQEPLVPLSCDRLLLVDVEKTNNSSRTSHNCSSDSDSVSLASSSPLVDDQRTTPPTDLSLEKLLDGSELVLLGDRDLVPEPLYISMAQMKPCRLLEGDRVGSYKGRPVGFIGFCCKHCGGQPGYGKFFPNSVRSLAQTTTSQTIVKHIAAKCRYTPPRIREVVIEYQRQLLENEKSIDTRPRYGSRKVFFQRIWSRLHDDDLIIPSSPTLSRTDGVLENTTTIKKEQQQQQQRNDSMSTENKKKTRPAKGKSKQSNLKRKTLFAAPQSPKRHRASAFAML